MRVRFPSASVSSATRRKNSESNCRSTARSRIPDFWIAMSLSRHVIVSVEAPSIVRRTPTFVVRPESATSSDRPSSTSSDRSAIRTPSMKVSAIYLPLDPSTRARCSVLIALAFSASPKRSGLRGGMCRVPVWWKPA